MDVGTDCLYNNLDLLLERKLEELDEKADRKIVKDNIDKLPYSVTKIIHDNSKKMYGKY